MSSGVWGRYRMGLSFQHVKIVGLGFEGVQFGGIAGLDFQHPAALVRIGIDQFGLVGQGRIDGRDFATHRHVQLGYGLDRFDGTELIALGEAAAHLGQFHEDHVTQLVLGVVGNTDAHHLANGFGPFVVIGISHVFRQIEFTDRFHPFPP
ncbi:hypothetical protein DESC_740137 [Desulfosarcina cetonica]|nr:hypothetical protein DESC_740137 [Desulfosarcina cetonica]